MLIYQSIRVSEAEYQKGENDHEVVNDISPWHSFQRDRVSNRLLAPFHVDFASPRLSFQSITSTARQVRYPIVRAR